MEQIGKSGSLIKQGGRGFEEPIEREDLIIPRASLLQSKSPEVEESIEKGDGKFKPGMIINSLTKEILAVEFVPVFKFTNWIRFNPRKREDPNFDPAFDAGEIIWRSTDPMDPKVIEEAQFGPDGEKPKATKFMNFFCLFPGQQGPVIVSFSKTSFKAGKKLISLALRAAGDMFSQKYRLGTKKEEKDSNTYFVLTVEPAGPADEQLFKAAEGFYDQFAAKAKDLKIHEEGQAAESAAAPEGN
jgi:hypothetical protein